VCISKYNRRSDIVDVGDHIDVGSVSRTHQNQFLARNGRSVLARQSNGYYKRNPGADIAILQVALNPQVKNDSGRVYTLPENQSMAFDKVD